MSPRMTHIALHVESINDCVDFYQQFCGLKIVEGLHDNDDSGVIWLAEPHREKDFIMVLIPNGRKVHLTDKDYQHLGFALESKEAVDQMAEKGKQHQCLLWPPRQDDFPVGYYCGLNDPNGHIVEFSYGQPIGPGSEIKSLSAC